MGKKWIIWCLAGCLSLMLCMVSAELSSVYAKGGKIFAMEGTVFDLKSSTSGLTVYGFVSDKEKHPVVGATVIIKSNSGGKGEGQTGSSGFYGFGGLEDDKTYTIEAKKSGVGSKKSTIKVEKNEDESFVINFKFTGIDN